MKARGESGFEGERPAQDLMDLAKGKNYPFLQAYLELSVQSPEKFPTAFEDGEVGKTLSLSTDLKARGATALISLEEMALMSEVRIGGKIVGSAGDSFVGAYLIGHTPKQLEKHIGLNPVKNIQEVSKLAPSKQSVAFAEESFARCLDFANQLEYRHALMSALARGIGTNPYTDDRRKPLNSTREVSAKKELDFDDDVKARLGSYNSGIGGDFGKIMDEVTHFNQAYLKGHYFDREAFFGLIKTRLQNSATQRSTLSTLKEKGFKFYQGEFFKDYYGPRLKFLDGVFE